MAAGARPLLFVTEERKKRLFNCCGPPPRKPCSIPVAGQHVKRNFRHRTPQFYNAQPLRLIQKNLLPQKAPCLLRGFSKKSYPIAEQEVGYANQTRKTAARTGSICKFLPLHWRCAPDMYSHRFAPCGASDPTAKPMPQGITARSSLPQQMQVPLQAIYTTIHKHPAGSHPARHCFLQAGATC